MAETAPRFLPAGEAALSVEFGATIDPELNAKVRGLDAALTAAPIDGIVETVPTYRALMIHFDPRVISSAELIEAIGARSAAPFAEPFTARHWLIPVCYALAEDLALAAQTLGISEDDIIALHQGATYQVMMYGFAPGYVFLGGLPASLGISRRPTPRAPVPRGSLLIAGGQALIGHDPMPTGWYHLGRTPLRTFDAERQPPCLIGIGDRVSFEAIDAARFEALEAAARAGADVARRLA